MNSRHAMIQNAFSIDEKVAFLKQSKTYPHPVHAVQTKETHMSWIFLVDDFVYKLKKPVKYKYIDHRSIESRFKDCKREVRLNEKLAKDIYLDVVPLTSDDGKLQLSGNGLIEDWLVKMKRIPEEAMLDYAIKFNKIDENRLKEASLLLTNFYKQQPFILVTKEVFRKKLRKEIEDNYKELMQPAYELPKEVIQKLTNKLINFLDKHKAVFDERVLLETIIETHGDLRPEHIYLTSPPVIIDRLEFSRSLRIQDVAEELSYFVMECEMLGNASPGRIFFDVYIKQASDNIHPSLIFFYKIKRACLRAFLVARHITEQNDKRENWIKKANDYLALALEYNRNWQYD